ncbi:hypothetical protein [Sphingomonas sp.]|uniref:hypothetical protein n=1 Tax=Sphingomonas sp. TaxID=28214 RepID=UPI003B3A998D
MSDPSIVKGQYFDVAVFKPAIGSGSADTTTPTILCGLTTRNFTHQFNTTDDFIRDCEDKEKAPVRVVNVNGEQFDISGSGLYNRAQAPIVRAIVGKRLKYRFIVGEPADDEVDAGYYEGYFVLTNRQVGGADGANVTDQFTWISDGQVLWHDAA